MRQLMHEDVFPSNSDYVHPDDYNFGVGWALKPCKLCGAAVMRSHQDLHRAWHQGLMSLGQYFNGEDWKAAGT